MAPATIRLARPAEAAELASLQLRTALAGYGHIFPPDAPAPAVEDLAALWRAWLGADRTAVLVAQVDGEVVGVVLGGPDPEVPGAGHLARLYVDPDRWGQGIGGQLYAAAMDHLRAERFEQVTLWVLEANIKARSWYERLGWVATEDRKATYEPGGIFDVRYVIALSSSRGGATSSSALPW